MHFLRGARRQPKIGGRCVRCERPLSRREAGGQDAPMKRNWMSGEGICLGRKPQPAAGCDPPVHDRRIASGFEDLVERKDAVLLRRHGGQCGVDAFGCHSIAHSAIH